MGFSKEVKLEIVKTYWICGGSVTSARRLLQRRDMSKFGRLHTTTIVRIVKKLETDCSLVKNGRTGRPKSALSEKNVMRVKKKLESCPRRSTRTLSRELKLSRTAVWKILRKELKKFAYKIFYATPL